MFGLGAVQQSSQGNYTQVLVGQDLMLHGLNYKPHTWPSATGHVTGFQSQEFRLSLSKEVQLCAVLLGGCLSLHVCWEQEMCLAHSEMWSKCKIHNDTVLLHRQNYVLGTNILITPLNDSMSEILCLINT